MLVRALIVIYLALLVLSPAIRLSGVPGMRGITADQIFIPTLFCIATMLHYRSMVGSVAASMSRRLLVGRGYFVVALLAVVAAAGRVLFDYSGFYPFSEIARLYGLLRPILVVVAGVYIYRLAQKRVGVDPYEVTTTTIIIVGAIPISLGVAQGLGVSWAVNFLSLFYTRDLNFEEVLIYGRSYGTFDGQPNVFGTFCGLYILIALSRLHNVKSTLILGPLIILAGLGLLFSGSRGALLAFLIAITTWAVLSHNWRSLLVVAVGILCASVIVAIAADWVPPALLERLAGAVGLQESSGGTLAGSRMPYWTQVFLISDLSQPVME